MQIDPGSIRIGKGKLIDVWNRTRGTNQFSGLQVPPNIAIYHPIASTKKHPDYRHNKKYPPAQSISFTYAGIQIGLCHHGVFIHDRVFNSPIFRSFSLLR